MVWTIGQRKSQVYLMPFPTYCWQIWLPYCIICISPIIGIMQIIPSLFRGKMWKIAIGLVQLALSAAGVLLFFTTPTVSGGMCINSAFTTWQAGIKPPLGGDEWLACTLASQHQVSAGVILACCALLLSGALCIIRLRTTSYKPDFGINSPLKHAGR